MFVKKVIRCVLFYFTRLFKYGFGVKQNGALPEADKINKNAQTTQAQHLSHQLLERRLLLDAAAFTTLADTADNIEDDEVDSILDALGLNEQLQPDAASQATTREIFIVDSAVSNSKALLSSMGASENVYYIDSTSDGFVQLSNILGQLNDIDAIHVISHGNTNEIRLGDATLTSNNVDQYQNTFSQCPMI